MQRVQVYCPTAVVVLLYCYGWRVYFLLNSGVSGFHSEVGFRTFRKTFVYWALSIHKCLMIRSTKVVDVRTQIISGKPISVSWLLNYTSIISNTLICSWSCLSGFFSRRFPRAIWLRSCTLETIINCETSLILLHSL